VIAGLEMDETEKKRRMSALARSVREQDINWWWQSIQQYWLSNTEAEGEAAGESSHGSVIGSMLNQGIML